MPSNLIACQQPQVQREIFSQPAQPTFSVGTRDGFTAQVGHSTQKSWVAKQQVTVKVSAQVPCVLTMTGIAGFTLAGVKEDRQSGIGLEQKRQAVSSLECTSSAEVLAGTGKLVGRGPE